MSTSIACIVVFVLGLVLGLHGLEVDENRFLERYGLEIDENNNLRRKETKK